MLQIPSPILIFGDNVISKNIINSAKKKYFNAYWEEISLTNFELEDIRTKIGFNSFAIQDKIILLYDIPNKKAIREFILDIIKQSTENLKFVIWDSNNHISIDLKTKLYNKTWIDFINSIKKTENHKIIDNGFDFNDKESSICIKYIQDCFKKFNKIIDNDASIIFMDIVGKNRGMIYSEVQKLCINCPNNIDSKFIIDNTFPTSTEAILYKFGNAIDTGNIEVAFSSIEYFLSKNVHIFVLADILMKKARWQLVVCHLWAVENFKWEEITDTLMDMGKFPSVVWHSDLSINEKRNNSIKYDNIHDKQQFMINDLGIPSYYFYSGDDKISSETIPMRFMAQQIVDFIRLKIVSPNSKYNIDELKIKMFNRSLNLYLEMSNYLKELRYSNNINILHDMIFKLINNNLEENYSENHF